VDSSTGPVAAVILDSTATLRPTGVGRYFNAAFLGIWLAGWAVGEIVALGILVMMVIAPMLRRDGVDIPGWIGNWSAGAAVLGIFLFILVWVTFWTIGGIAAMTAFLRSLAGKDRLRLVPTGLEVMRGAGPFTRTRLIDRTDIRRIRVRHHDHALVADTTFGTVCLTDLGTPLERETICAWLRGVLQLPPDGVIRHDADKAPPGWKMQPTGDGSVGLRRRAAWLPWLRTEWIVRRGLLTHRRRIGPRVSEHSYDHAQFAIEHTTDSDGDDLYRLILRSARGDRTIQSAINDEGEIVECARWFASRTGFELQLWK
jgi:hypothetical protein